MARVVRRMKRKRLNPSEVRESFLLGDCENKYYHAKEMGRMGQLKWLLE